MRFTLLGGLAMVAVCLPCVITLLVASGVGAGTLSAAVLTFGQSALAVAAAMVGAALLAMAGALLMRRRTRRSCETESAGAGAAAGTGARSTNEVG